LFWPERDNTEARRNLRKLLFDTLALAEAAGIESNEHALRWPVSTDLQRLHAAIDDQRWADAVACRRGPALGGLDNARLPAWTDWLTAERERIELSWHRAALARLRELRDPAARIALASDLVREDPLDEQAVAEWVQAELDGGAQSRAQQVYHAYAARLAEEFAIEPPQRLRNLLGAATPTVDGAPVLVAAVPPGDEDQSFIGRRFELAELERLFAGPSCRWVTLVGAGGMGKSRLARHAVARMAHAHWVELQDLADCGAVLARLANVLGVHLSDGNEAVAALGRRIAGREVLVVFDNAEHLNGLAALVEQLLDVAPRLRLLLTSRSRLGGPRETMLPLTGLAVPDDQSRDLEAAVAFDAVRLFATRAEAIQRGFVLAPQLAAVIEIVEACAGMPLAIELAASWVRLLPPNVIARDLRTSNDLLERDPATRGLPARPEHVSLRALLERSWQMLSPAEQHALAALSVFRGGFHAADARAVAAVPIALLSSLADKSLLSAEDGRFGLHPLVLAHAAERLGADAARAAALARRHADHFAQTVATLTRTHSADHQPLVESIEGELSNILAAWDHAIAHENCDAVCALAPGLRTYFHVRGRITEGVLRLRRALLLPERGAAFTAALAQVQCAVASLLYQRRDLEESRQLALAGLLTAERCGDRRLQFACLATMGACHSTSGRWPQALPLFERALAIAREDGERAEAARALADLGVIAKKEGQFDLALERYSQALAINRELGRPDAAARCLNNIGTLWMERDQWAHAREVMSEGVALCERHRVDSLLPYLQNGLGLALFELGELDAAERELERALQRSRATEVQSVEMLSDCLLARVATQRGRLDTARARFQTAARLARQLNMVTDLLDIALYYAECQRDAGQSLEAARTWSMIRGHPSAEAGIRHSAARWADALALDEADRAALAARPATLDEVIDALLMAPADPRPAR